MAPALGIDVAAPRERVWQELVDLDRWPRWGPTVRAARLDDGGRELHAGATGAVLTPVGLWLPFTVEQWSQDGGRWTWSWRVAGVPATTHSVAAAGPGRSRLEMTVPWWAPAYLGVVRVALTRIRRDVEGGRQAGPAA
jgi:hypothetical protein